MHVLTQVYTHTHVYVGKCYLSVFPSVRAHLGVCLSMSN